MAVNTFIGNVTFPDFLLFIFIIILAIIISALVSFTVRKVLDGKVRPRIYRPISQILQYSIVIGAVYYGVNNIIHFNVPAGLAALGVLGIVTILPAVPVLQGYAAGIVLAFERPFREDDYILYGDEICRVMDIHLRRTKLRSANGKIIFVPNLTFITGSPVINYTSGEFIRIVKTLSISSNVDVPKFRAIVESVCTNNPNILPNIPPQKMTRLRQFIDVPVNFFKSKQNLETLRPRVYVKNIGKENLEFEIWFWIWDITLREQSLSTFLQDLRKELKIKRIKWG